MKIGTITTPNPKGQIVIPKEIRNQLGISSHTPLHLVPRGGGLYLYPVEQIITKHESENSYSQILQKTQGSWAQGSWAKTRKSRKTTEIAASKNRKHPW
jgi:AbrB family looped-hinge helix DNA binding protein